MKPRCALALLSAAWFGCSRAAPPIEDPGVKLYHDAVVLFAKLSDDTQDLSYRDARFDDVLSLCDEVPAVSDLRPKAQALALRIREARVAAEVSDKASAQAQAQAEAAPEFQPQPRDAVLEPARPAPNGPPGANAQPNAQAGAFPGAPSSSPISYGSKPSVPVKAALPDWYRQKGYFGLKPDAPAPAVPVQADVAPAEPAAGAPTASPSQSSAAPRPAAVDPQAPPAIFGLPGPAGHAYQPPPPPPQ